MEGKKSVIFYTDWIEVFDDPDLTDEEAGRLIKHFVRYINDKNPEAPDRLTSLLFKQIKTALKRDLKKWEQKQDKKSESGILGNLKRWHNDLYSKVINNELDINEANNIAKSRKESQPDKVQSQRVANIAVSDSVSVSDSVNVSDKKKEYNYSLEREILKSVYHLFDEKYYLTDKQKKDWLETIRKCLTIDNRPKQQIIDVITYARNDDFWQSNLLTINALRKKNKDGVMKFDSILARMPKQNNDEQQSEQVPEHIKKSLGIR